MFFFPRTTASANTSSYKAQGPETETLPGGSPSESDIYTFVRRGLYLVPFSSLFGLHLPQAELGEIKFGEDMVELLLGQRLLTHRCRHYQEMVPKEMVIQLIRDSELHAQICTAHFPLYKSEKCQRITAPRARRVGSPWA